MGWNVERNVKCDGYFIVDFVFFSLNNFVYFIIYVFGYGYEVMFINLNLGNNRVCFSLKN